jgi:RNA polymerase sigma factor (sigma-70 family)
MITSDGAGGEAPKAETFEAFFRSDFPRLVAFLRLIGATSAEAEDAAMEAFVSAFRDWDSITQPRAWIRVVAQRALMKSRVRHDRADSAFMAIHRPTNPAAEWSERENVIEMLRALPQRQRIVMAYAIDGFDSEEIAQLLGISPQTVRSNLRHARKSLAARLAQQKKADMSNNG